MFLARVVSSMICSLHNVLSQVTNCSKCPCDSEVSIESVKWDDNKVIVWNNPSASFIWGTLSLREMMNNCYKIIHVNKKS